MCVLCFLTLGNAALSQDTAAAPVKTQSVFYAPDLIARATANASTQDWAQAMQRDVVANAQRWLELPDDTLWNAMFGPNIPRTWMVWSDGYCPACKADVRMYTWEMDPFTFPWKVRCPHCKALFPTNDFEAFHRSGYDEHGVFQPERADRSLLFNAEHPDPADPLHLFGVDDGTGYEADGHRWRFLGAYVIYGQWKKWVHAGIENLSAAYAVTGDSRYAYKAAIMLDRVADIFPSFDFHTQGGLVYETIHGTRGQISTWHDACEEVRILALAYDRIFDGAKAQEAALTAYLSEKARAHQLSNPKTSWADIQRNIETGIFVDTLNHRERIESNYPRTDIALLVIKTVLGWPGNRDEILGLVDAIVEKATAVDGVSGEKGMAGYTTIAPRALAEILSQMARLEPNFLATMFERLPALRNTYRFHLDTWCMESWYPRTGDTGAFGQKDPSYAGVSFTKNPGVEPSMFTFLMDVSKLTADPGLVQVLYLANNSSVDGLPYDLFAEDPAAFQSTVQTVIDEQGATPILASVNKENWHLAILRSGEGEHRRALWLDYDAGERHGHADGMNLGLFAKGLDLIPDYGYPPVGYGGWGAPRAVWYTMTAAHATVVVDGKNQTSGAGQTTLWADGERFRAVRANAPALVGGEVYQRTAILVDVNDTDFYVVDHFRVVGGLDHAKFFHSSFGVVTPQGLNLQEAPPYSDSTQMRTFRSDPRPAPGWSVDWELEDVYGYTPEGKKVHVRYTDLTEDAEASLAEGWVDIGQYGSESRWIPRVMVRRTAQQAPLASTFVSTIDPYEGEPNVQTVTRAAATTPAGAPLPEGCVVLKIERKDGAKDLLFIADGDTPVEMVEPESGARFHGVLGHIVLRGGHAGRVAAAKASQVTVPGLTVTLNPDAGFVELHVGDGGTASVVRGNPDAVIGVEGAVLSKG